MKKLYKKSTVHPSPPLISDHLALLPAAIFTLTVALSPEDKEVLAYLVSSTNSTTNKKAAVAAATVDHSPLFNCGCFRCYMSYWVRWDSSPNRQLIHEIIDAYEDSLVQNKREKGKKDRKKKVSSNSNRIEDTIPAESIQLSRSPELSPAMLKESESVAECEEGPVRKLVSFLWSVWT